MEADARPDLHFPVTVDGDDVRVGAVAQRIRFAVKPPEFVRGGEFRRP